MQNFVELGKRIYNLNNVREAHRFVVFVTRCTFNASKMRKIIKFFQSSELLSRVAETFPFVYEQPTRAFFYNRSTFEERINLIDEHMSFLQSNLKSDIVESIYSNKPLSLWQMDLDDEFKSMELTMGMEAGQRKEGLLSLKLRLNDNRPLYQIMFWIAKDKVDDWAMWIGALQGPNMEDAKEVVKKITKKCHAYRTKNLILYAAQAVARNLDLKKIYAVTNEGYYANNHVRIDRKLKTSFSDFWIETGGSHTDDDRFDLLPLIETRKSAEEIPTRKRAVYRRRFALLDEIDTAIEERIKAILIR
ncbi:MAG: DUF535 domain-containing protein [Selenomonadaceae bacterium]|nr:DUF535 domain-containing protein [Selenomonadaceae bacterium]